MWKKIVIILLIISAFFAGKYLEKLTHPGIEEDAISMERSGTGYLINPLLECEVKTYGGNQKYIPFEKDVKAKIQDKIIDQNKDIHVSVYFRNLRNGPWFGIEEDADFSPASLMKLPIAMAYAKWEELYPGVIDLVVTGSIDTSAVQNIIPEKHIEGGKSYSIDELIRYALIFSDNNANYTLLSYLPKDIIYKVFLDLNIPIIDKLEGGIDDYISVKEYASFFRILYNASYLSELRSSYLLDIMTQSTISHGIKKLIPSNIQVAHKFGERRLIDPVTGGYISQFHDCGIIYYEKYPYILCVMTKGGDNIPRLEGIVENISQIIFEEIQKRYP